MDTCLSWLDRLRHPGPFSCCAVEQQKGGDGVSNAGRASHGKFPLVETD